MKTEVESPEPSESSGSSNAERYRTYTYRFMEEMELDHNLTMNQGDRNSVIVVDDDDSDSDSDVEYLGSYSIIEIQSTETAPPLPKREKYLGECPVCLEDFTKKQKVSTLCGHIFCVDCIIPIITLTHTCPTCRTEISCSCVHPVYL